MPFSTLTTFSSLTNGANLSVEYLGGKMGLLNTNIIQINTDLASAISFSATTLTTGAISTNTIAAASGSTVQLYSTLSSSGGAAFASPILEASGTALAPSYAFSSEASLGLYRSAASVLQQSYGTFIASGISTTAITAGTVNYTTLNPAITAVSALGMASSISFAPANAKSVLSIGLPANKLSINGQQVRITFDYTYTAGFGSGCTIVTKFGATTVNSTTPLSNAQTENGKVLVNVGRTGAATQNASGMIWRTNAAATTAFAPLNATPTETLSSVVTIDVQGTTHSSADTLLFNNILIESLST